MSLVCWHQHVTRKRNKHNFSWKHTVSICASKPFSAASLITLVVLLCFCESLESCLFLSELMHCSLLAFSSVSVFTVLKQDVRACPIEEFGFLSDSELSPSIASSNWILAHGQRVFNSGTSWQCHQCLSGACWCVRTISASFKQHSEALGSPSVQWANHRAMSLICLLLFVWRSPEPKNVQL